MIKIYITFFFYQGFLSWRLTTHRTAGKGRWPSFVPLYHFHPLTNIQTFICNFACEMTITSYFHSHRLYFQLQSHQTATRWDLPPYRITIWLIDVTLVFFVFLRDNLILDFLLQQFETGNRLTRTLIDYYPCITSEPTDQAR